MFRALSTFFVALVFAASAAAQGQAINGTIEGTVTDESGAVLPGVTGTLTDIDTGDTRASGANTGRPEGNRGTEIRRHGDHE
jgi:hypothetical protein